MGSLDHAKTELLNLSTWKWKKSSPYPSHQQVHSFAAVYYQDKFHVVGGKTKNEVLSAVATFNPKTEEWNQIGKLKFPRFDHKLDLIDNKLFIVDGSPIPEYCDLSDFSCSMFTDATFKLEDRPTLYAFYPRKCKLGIQKIVSLKFSLKEQNL